MFTLRGRRKNSMEDRSQAGGCFLAACSLCALCYAWAAPRALRPPCSGFLVSAVLIVLSCLICIFLMVDEGQHPSLSVCHQHHLL